MRNGSAPTSFFVARRFGRFELRPGERVLLADGALVTVGARAFDVLVALTDRPGTLITKEELLATVWPDVVVEENNLQVQVSTLRKILGQSALATIPGRGYRFNMAVAGADAAQSEPAVDSRAIIVDSRFDAPATSARTNLPSRLPWLYGRSDDLVAIARLLREHAVVTITGPGGIGKTRVAQAVAKEIAIDAAGEYPDGVWWVELASLVDGELVPSAIGQAMGVRLAGDRPSALALQLQLAALRAMFVLDNCEHLAGAVAAVADAVTAGAPGIRILVTSQETLRAADEHVYRLGALAVPVAPDVETALRAGAVELFAARAQAVDPNFVVTATNLPAVIEICRRLDGIPLAIELAAARLPLLGVEGLRTRLHERFSLLTAGARVVLRRHQTLRATLEWSHALLTSEEQTVFRRLGVFAGGFTLEAAQHVASGEGIDPWTALDHLGALVDKSLVLADGDSIPRYRMLETTRAYALERLAESGETPTILRRHGYAMLALLEPFDKDEWRWRATGNSVPAASVELDNLRAALEWADSASDGGSVAVALAGVSYSVWWSSFHLVEGLGRCLALRRHVDAGVPIHVAARFWITIAKLGLYASQRKSYDAAVQAAALYRTLQDDQRCFDALTFAAVQGARFATVAETQAQIAEATHLERPEWPARQRATLQFARCWWFAGQGRIEEALACAERQVAICRDGGVEVAALYGIANLTLMKSLLGRSQEAVDEARIAIARLHELGHDAGASHLYCNEMIALLTLDRLDEAFVAARNAYPRLLHEGDQYRMLLPLALLTALQGRLEVSARVAGFDDAMQARIGQNVRSVVSFFRRRLDPLLAAHFSADVRARLEAEGAASREEDLFRTALGDAV